MKDRKKKAHDGITGKKDPQLERWKIKKKKKILHTRLIQQVQLIFFQSAERGEARRGETKRTGAGRGGTGLGGHGRGGGRGQ